MTLEHRQILHLYNSVLRGYLNYYNFAHNYPRVATSVTYVLKQSCAKLLAAKYSMGTMSKVHQRFGPNLSTIHKDAKGKEKVYSLLTPSYKLSLKFLINSSPVIKALYGSISLASLDNLRCALCDSEYRIEMHEIKHMKDLNPKLNYLHKLMARRQRKQIPLCRQCHMGYHKGEIKIPKIQ